MESIFIMNNLTPNKLRLRTRPSFLKVVNPAVLAPMGILICLMTIVSPVVGQTIVGHILDIKGDWYLYPEGAESVKNVKLSKWQDVPPGGVIRITSPSRDDYISIADIHLNILVERKCAGPNTCYQPIFLPRSLKENEFSESIDSILPKVWAVLWGEPYETSLHRTRGASPLFDEEIAPLVKGELNLKQLMNPMPNGTYSVVAYHPKLSNQRTEINSFSWEPTANTAPVLTLTPGLYEISLSTKEGYQPLPNVSMRLLVMQSEDYPVARTAFQKVRASTEKWASAASPETVHAFLRAYLSELSSASGMKKP